MDVVHYLPCGTARGEWCPTCYSNVKGRTNQKGHLGYRPPPKRKAWQMALRRRRDLTGGPGEGASIPVNLGAWADRYPLLGERLSATSWDEGKPRVPDTLTLSCEDGFWKGTLRDRDEGFVLFVTTVTPDGVLELLERHLEDDDGEWRRDKFHKRWSGRKGS